MVVLVFVVITVVILLTMVGELVSALMVVAGVVSVAHVFSFMGALYKHKSKKISIVWIVAFGKHWTKATKKTIH